MPEITLVELLEKADAAPTPETFPQIAAIVETKTRHSTLVPNEVNKLVPFVMHRVKRGALTDPEFQFLIKLCNILMKFQRDNGVTIFKPEELSEIQKTFKSPQTYKIEYYFIPSLRSIYRKFEIAQKNSPKEGPITSVNNILELPFELHLMILEFVDLKTLIRTRRVSKEFYNLINSAITSSLHLRTLFNEALKTKFKKPVFFPANFYFMHFRSEENFKTLISPQNDFQWYKQALFFKTHNKPESISFKQRLFPTGAIPVPFILLVLLSILIPIGMLTKNPITTSLSTEAIKFTARSCTTFLVLLFLSYLATQYASTLGDYEKFDNAMLDKIQQSFLKENPASAETDRKIQLAYLRQFLQ